MFAGAAEPIMQEDVGANPIAPFFHKESSCNSKALIDANLERAAFIAELCARRAENVGTVGAWHGYRASEGLEGILVRDDILRYARPGSDNGDQFADIFFHEPKLTDVKEVDWGKETPVEKDVIERYHSSITKIKGVEYDDKIQHTSSRRSYDAPWSRSR